VNEITLGIESPRQADVVRLIEALDAYQSGLYPPESNHLLDLDGLGAPSVRFFVARRDGQALGCAGLRIDQAGWGELKRMFVSPEARGLKLGRRLLDRIEEEARREGLGWVRLETGIYQPEALGLYRSAGYVEREAFGDYVSDPLSVFMEKRL
jgi:putative acetyltransferase